MPKHGFLTPKAIGNRIKAKGLSKLRWFCQMCAKQCRDENGFKCHLTSEGHMRQMRIFAEDPDAVMDEYSEEFENNFLEMLSHRHGTKRVAATIVYNEFIADKMHVHMNSTKFETLTSFIIYLGKTGKCVVDETEKGWYVQYIDRDPEEIARQEKAMKRKKKDLDDEERQARAVEQQVVAAHALAAARAEEEGLDPQGPTELQRDQDAEAIKIKLGGTAAHEGPSGAKRPRLATPSAFFEEPEAKPAKGAGESAKKSALELLMEQDQKRKAGQVARDETEGRKDYWLHPGIVVKSATCMHGCSKVMNKKVAEGRFYKQKASVTRVIEKYVGELRMLEGGEKLRVDQDQLETVIPAVGGAVMVVNGRCRGCKGKLQDLDIDNYCATVKVMEGPRKGVVLQKVDYEDISRLLDEDA